VSGFITVFIVYLQGEWVWVDSDIGVPIGARVKETPSGQHFLVDDEGKEQKLSLEQEASLRIMHPTSVEGVDDMIKLGDMTEAGLLRNLLLRHKQGLIYTYTGSVLVAVNPYKDYPIYSNDQVRLYQGRKLGELPPHIFAIAESCYFNMTRHLRNQCCIISGESGAGKTESTKLILQYLAAVSGELSEQQIEKQILESNPILEAFGNAKTIRNDNSSRFGKYLEIFFNKDGVIEGARVEQYLLEKSRVCHQALEERNYHIFYCMLAGITAEEKKNLSLGNAKEYKFLTKGDCILCEGRDDAKDYDRIHSALKILTFSEKQHQKILKLLAAILHLGNVSFEGQFASFKSIGMILTKPLSSEQASDCRDALVKAIYNKLFIWIATKINSVIYKKLTNNPKKSYLSIGLLDIFGFENFEINSFEQLCINFANEKLQQFFVSHIFKLEQEEYLKEDIVWNNIKFSDNQSILDLLAGKPCNLLALIDEESHFPKGSDSTLLQKVNVQHKGSKVYIPSKSEHDTDFGICHFAGAVHYNSNGFLEKNRDAVSYDIIKMVDISTNELLHQIFENELSNNGPKMANNRKVIMTPKSSLRQVPTLSGQFRQSLDSLMKALSACQPFFIRCFKPNNDKQSELFDRELCMRQLRYSGMMDTVRIRKLGYPVQHTFKDFLNRYRVLLNTTICNPKTSVIQSSYRVTFYSTSDINSVFTVKKMSGQEEETSFDPSELQEAIPRAWATPSPSLDEDEDEDENEFDDENDEFSFYKFSILHFQDADHKHITQRLKKSLLTHDDEADELPDNLTEDEDIMIGEEKLHIIVGYAMSRPGIRDEIYCQICKQLVNNHNRRSRRLGWTLLSVCLGIFPPTNLFLKCLENFISKGLRDYKEYCSNRLYRVIANGERKELPCWVELQAAKSKAPIDASVTLMDGRSVDLPLESASTSAEVCQAVADQLGLKDTYGFSLYISLYEKMWSLNSCEKHVLDAVSQCEQEMRRQNKEEKDAPWRLSIRKEMFAPWHDCSLDPVSTDLIYRQVIKGIKNGEYMTDKEDECIQLAAMHYYIQFGSEYDRENVQSVVEECIPTHLIENKSMTKWIQLISSPLLQTQGRERVKGQLVEMARQKWTLDFSRFFEVTMMSGPPLPKSRFVVAVNWTGILFMERRDKRLREIPYLEVKKNYVSAQHMTLTTFRGEFVLRSGEARSMAAVMEENVEGLRQRSVYALAQEAIKSDDPMFLVCKRGDLLLVDKDESSHDRDWIRARNERTGDSGAVYKRMIEYLPTLTKPTDAMLVVLNAAKTKKISGKQDYFSECRPCHRSAGKDAGRPKGTGKEKLWASSREPLKQPLLKSLVRKSDLNHMACSYMGDYPIKQMRSPMELTDLIFGPATQHKELQDEIYCQIMKQMTSNNNRLSMERGWQLLWMCTGLFPPSDNLMGHAQRFVESRRRDLLAAGCLQRLKEPRKLPPHLAEVEAIQQNVMNIFHKVHFPNEKSDIFEVASTITIKDLCYSITSNLKLSSAEGYGLYLKTPTKVGSDYENRYFFDCLRQITSVPKKGKKVKEGNASCLYLKFSCRKLWFNVSPGKDIIADLTFHFPQEVPKYLHGFHNCTKENMITLGGLLFRAQVDSDRSQFVMIPRMLKGLVPADQLKIMVPEEWKKHIISSYNKQSGMTVQEAKITFLRTVSSWPAFGCDFYEVKQTCERSYPNPLWIGINKQGVSLIDPTSKELLVMHQFNRIIEYYSKGNSFTMTIGTLVRGNSFVCETSQADQMEDLIRSYVSMYERQIQDFRPRNAVNQLLFI
uniref:Myosin VIIBb n=1 Tax=Amphiprion ocellaris TaxID=80972 RepID=A0AAQ5X3P7_AMPOC